MQVEYIIKSLIKPILDRDFTVLDVKEVAEMCDANHVQERLKNMVWSGGCLNWNLDSRGRNTTDYHDNTWKFWYDMYWPVWNDFNLDGDTGYRPLHPLTKLAIAAAAGISAVGLSVSLSKALIKHLRSILIGINIILLEIGFFNWLD